MTDQAHPEPGLRRRDFLPGTLALGSLSLVAAATPVRAQAPAGLTSAPASQASLSPRLTMHAIDIFHGSPGAAMKVEFSVADGAGYRLVKAFETNRGGRTDEPLLLDDTYRAGRYEVVLHVADYFARLGAKLPEPAFLSTVPLRFVIRNAAERIHLAILFTPWSYSYYRGS